MNITSTFTTDPRKEKPLLKGQGGALSDRFTPGFYLFC